MEGQSLQRWALKELAIWGSVVATGYATFFAFEPLYDRVRQTAAEAGYGGVFESGTAGRGTPQFETRVATVSPPFRGTIPASHGLPPNAPKTVVLHPNSYGHFVTTATINGQQVEFMTDTGATYVALSYETAQAIGLTPQNLRFTGRSTTANGVARVASVTIDQIRVGDITVKDVQAVVAEPGRMTQNLLGMSFIRQLSGFELKDSTLIMKE
jgi:aspartyl protease family protein